MEGISGMCNAGNSAANGYSPLDFYAGAAYYESTPEITQNIENYIFVADEAKDFIIQTGTETVIMRNTM